MNDENPTNPTLEQQTVTTVSLPAKTSRKPVLLFVARGSVILFLAAAAWSLQQHSQAAAAKKNLTSATTKLTAAQSENKQLAAELDQRKNTTGEENIDKSAFQAVFLKNDQVYFGKITKLTETQVVLTDIFYIKQGSSASGDINSPSGSVSLVKLGDELHAPQDTMYIERAEMNFWENLKPDGRVSKAIAEYQKQNP